ncbi:MAG: hypothetical protein J6R47_04615 [Acholeplasmatales bacterium]|nr:hypothetical protein [Acholeplasmatales bacterium]
MNNGTQLSYIGEVKIKVGRKTYSNHNSGTLNLFALFARLLCGHKIEGTELPAYIDIIDTKAENQPSILNQMLNITRQYKVGSLLEQKAVITTVINDSNLLEITAERDSEYELVLYNGQTDKTKLASIKIEASILNQILAGRQALIEWSLYITNKSTTEAKGDK